MTGVIVGLVFLVLAFAGAICDRWPTEDQRSVDTFTEFRQNLGGDR